MEPNPEKLPCLSIRGEQPFSELVTDLLKLKDPSVRFFLRAYNAQFKDLGAYSDPHNIDKLGALTRPPSIVQLEAVMTLALCLGRAFTLRAHPESTPIVFTPDADAFEHFKTDPVRYTSKVKNLLRIQLKSQL